MADKQDIMEREINGQCVWNIVHWKSSVVDDDDDDGDESSEEDYRERCSNKTEQYICGVHFNDPDFIQLLQRKWKEVDNPGVEFNVHGDNFLRIHYLVDDFLKIDHSCYHDSFDEFKLQVVCEWEKKKPGINIKKTN
mmetsp:Transcript_23246/g.36239  ORF Transcript_23246/g.36239 Transcript_23246/m.36239 type:complete len:137 (-) Transcript_23246:27-437(-)